MRERTVESKEPITLDALVREQPRLQLLDVTTPAVSGGGFRAPFLEILYADVPDAASLTAALAASELPRLVTLRIGAGSIDSHWPAEAALPALLDHPPPALRRLLLLGVDRPGKALELLAASALVRGASRRRVLRELSVSGHFDTRELDLVRRHRAFFDGLEELVISPVGQDATRRTRRRSPR